MADVQTKTINAFSDEAEKIINSVQSKTFIESIIDKIEKEDTEAAAPPK